MMRQEVEGYMGALMIVRDEVNHDFWKLMLSSTNQELVL